MQDINPIRKSIKVSEINNSDSEDIRTKLGVGESADNNRVSDEDPLPNRREQVSFSELYTPESRRNKIARADFPTRKNISQSAYENSGNAEKSKSKYSFIFWLIGLGLLIGIILYTFIFSTATVKITPVRTNINIEQTITVPQIDLELGDSVKVVVASTTASKSLPRRAATKVETKASGVITIYNNFDTNPQKLITNTRFESATGKIYRIAESVTVPGMKSGAAGSVDATVYADSIGSDYNISEGQFTVPGFKGTTRYTKFSAKVKTAITGGSSGTQEVVADEDISSANTELSDKLKEEYKKTTLSNSPGEDYIAIPDVTILEFSDNKKEISADKNLDYTVELTAKSFFIKKDYLAKKILESSSYTEEDNLTLENINGLVFGSATQTGLQEGFAFTLNGTANFISKLDEVLIKSALLQTKKSDFSEIMSKFNGISTAEPSFNPFWIKTFPKDSNKIKVELINK